MKEERSFILHTNRATVSLIIGHQYLSLEVDCNQQCIIGLSGYFNIELCKTGHISYLNFEEHTLAEIIPESLLLECGLGYDYKIFGEAIFDPNSKRLLIGRKTKGLKFIPIGNNVIIGLFEAQIICIQIENIQF